MAFYAVLRGIKNNIIYTNWNDVKINIEGIDNPKYRKFETEKEAIDYINENNIIYVYTDGGCINNGKPNAKASIGIYFGYNDPRNVSSLIDGKQTNNTAELKAIIGALNILHKEIKENLKINIITDSEYAIKCATTYSEKLSKVNWEIKDKKIPNIELLKELYNITSKYKNISFKHIEAHTNKQDKHSLGNYNADLLANLALDIKVKDKEDNNKIYLNVAYANKDEAKVLGARWDPSKKKWYIFENNINKDKILEKFK